MHLESPEEYRYYPMRRLVGSPIVVMKNSVIPSVEMLELLEHGFHAEHVVFVVAINRSELIHSMATANGLIETCSVRSDWQYIALLQLFRASHLAPCCSLSIRKEIDKSILHLGVDHITNLPTYYLMQLLVARLLHRSNIEGLLQLYKALADAIFAKGTCNNLRTSQDMQENFCTKELESILIGASLALPRGSASVNYGSIIAKSELYKMHKEISGTNCLMLM